MEVCLTWCYSYRLPFISITIYVVVCGQLAHFSIGDWNDISIAHLNIIVKSEVWWVYDEFMMSANSRIHFGLQIVLVCLYITPSHFLSLCKLIWRHWTYKMPVRYILSSVWVRLIIVSQLSILRYVGLCVFSLPISLVMIARIYTVCLQVIIIIKSEVWSIT